MTNTQYSQLVGLVQKKREASNMKLKTQAAHTPGPWEVYEQEDGSDSIRTIKNEINQPRYVVIPDQGICGKDVGQAEANARLIAAAPDLLEAVKRLIKDLEPAYMPGSIPGSIEAGCAAIAKAEGGK